MKKKQLVTRLALLGVTAGIGFGCQSSDAGQSEMHTQESNGILTEEELLSQLSDKSKVLYENLSPEGKKLARKLSSQNCRGQNACKGLNACKTSSNECAGRGACKGQSPGPFHNKNLAVQVAAQKMTEKREKVLHPSPNSP